MNTVYRLIISDWPIQHKLEILHRLSSPSSLLLPYCMQYPCDSLSGIRIILCWIHKFKTEKKVHLIKSVFKRGKNIENQRRNDTASVCAKVSVFEWSLHPNMRIEFQKMKWILENDSTAPRWDACLEITGGLAVLYSVSNISQTRSWFYYGLKKGKEAGSVENNLWNLDAQKPSQLETLNKCTFPW